MSEIKKNAWVFLIWSTLAGTISFFIGGVVGFIFLLCTDMSILDTIIAGAIGGLLLGVFLRKRHKIGTMTIAGVVAVPVGFWASFGLGYAISEIPFIANSNVPDIWAIILMGAMVGALFGAIIYGRKSIWLFAVVGGVVSVALGFLVDALNSGQLDELLNVLGVPHLGSLPFMLLFGVSIGLSIGLYEIIKQRLIDSSTGKQNTSEV